MTQAEETTLAEATVYDVRINLVRITWPNGAPLYAVNIREVGDTDPDSGSSQAFDTLEEAQAAFVTEIEA